MSPALILKCPQKAWRADDVMWEKFCGGKCKREFIMNVAKLGGGSAILSIKLMLNSCKT